MDRQSTPRRSAVRAELFLLKVKIGLCIAENLDRCSEVYTVRMPVSKTAVAYKLDTSIPEL